MFDKAFDQQSDIIKLSISNSMIAFYGLFYCHCKEDVMTRFNLKPDY